MTDFLKVYLESDLDDDNEDAVEGLLPAVKVGDKVNREEVGTCQ